MKALAIDPQVRNSSSLHLLGKSKNRGFNQRSNMDIPRYFRLLLNVVYVAIEVYLLALLYPILSATCSK